MFTEEDLIGYFDQMEKIEMKMHETYDYLHENVDHPEYKEIFGRLAEEEKAHYNMLEHLKKLFVE